jgi:Phytanoyl-CoA dioxygenase (PhyH)
MGPENQHNLTLLRQAYQRDGVVAIRGLLDDREQLLQRLDVASAKHVQEQWDKQMKKQQHTGNRPRKARQGTQFFTNLNHLALTDLPFPSISMSASANNNNNTSCSADDESSSSSSSSSSSQSSCKPDETIINNYAKNNNNNIIIMNPFLETALLSQIPKMAVTLLGLTDENTASSSSSSGDSSNYSGDNRNENNNNNLRLMRDIFLAKDDDPYICGWHVDDFGFWPVTPTSPPGINAWIALDDYDVDVDGGGFALAVGSHVASWRDEAHYVTGASTTAPVDGYTSAKDLFERRTGSGTCNLKQSAPHLHRRMEETMRIYPQLHKGDVVLHDRWLFHRTVPLNKNFIEQRQRQQQQQDENDNGDSTLPPPILRRYSIRYGPGSSVIPPGYGTELSVLWDDNNGGKTANQVVCSNHEKKNTTTIVYYYPWYPQAWPNVLWDSELASLESLVQHQFPVALQRQERHVKEMKPHRKRLARQHNRPTLAGNQK